MLKASGRCVTIKNMKNKLLDDRTLSIFLLPLSERCHSWFEQLDIDNDIYNDSVTSQIGMTPSEAVKKALNS